MKNTILNILLAFAVVTVMGSCYTYSYNVGQGPQSGIEVKEKNHYLIYGLAPLNVSDPIQMAGDAENYNVTVEHTFIDGLINAITFGIYSPTTTVVTK